jgi:hypothetical protein
MEYDRGWDLWGIYTGPGSVLTADVSEHCIGSIFKGRSMKYDGVWDLWGIYTGLGSSRSVAPVILNRPSYEDGTDRVFRNVGY